MSGIVVFATYCNWNLTLTVLFPLRFWHLSSKKYKSSNKIKCIVRSAAKFKTKTRIRSIRYETFEINYVLVDYHVHKCNLSNSSQAPYLHWNNKIIIIEGFYVQTFQQKLCLRVLRRGNVLWKMHPKKLVLLKKLPSNSWQIDFSYSVCSHANLLMFWYQFTNLF